jgi:hypothetical protein
MVRDGVPGVSLASRSQRSTIENPRRPAPEALGGSEQRRWSIAQRGLEESGTRHLSRLSQVLQSSVRRLVVGERRTRTDSLAPTRSLRNSR